MTTIQSLIHFKLQEFIYLKVDKPLEKQKASQLTQEKQNKTILHSPAPLKKLSLELLNIPKEYSWNTSYITQKKFFEKTIPFIKN